MNQERISYWYFGGLASAGAACCTHPLDLIKVQMQTQKGKNISTVYIVKNIIKQQGIIGLYNGISASILRQLTYSLARFGIYETLKGHFKPKDNLALPFYKSVMIASAGGVAGGFVGTPADMVNIRMQNDSKLPPNLRRNYKNALHGLYVVFKTEGVTKLWNGASLACARAVLMTVGQISFYDLIKMQLLSTSYFSDNVGTHVTSSLAAGAIATTMTQPIDVLKTRAMNAKPGEFNGVFGLIMSTAKEGPLAFFKGFIPAFVRLAPHTILLFVFLEQLRLNFGYHPVITPAITEAN